VLVLVLVELDNSENLVGVLLLLGASDTIVIEDLLPLLGHTRV
jgi:hypothetical protein